MAIQIDGAVLEVLAARPSLYDPVDASTAALNELVAHWEALDELAAVRRGWPEHPEDLDLTAGPILTVTLIDERRTPVAPTGLPGGLVRTDRLELDVSVDLWAPHRAVRDEAARAVQAAMHNRLPWRHGLRLTSRGYYQRPLMAEPRPGRNVDEQQAAEVGEWRRTWLLTVQTDLVRALALPTQDTVTFAPTVGGVAEPDHTLT